MVRSCSLSHGVSRNVFHCPSFWWLLSAYFGVRNWSSQKPPRAACSTSHFDIDDDFLETPPSHRYLSAIASAHIPTPCSPLPPSCVDVICVSIHRHLYAFHTNLNTHFATSMATTTCGFIVFKDEPEAVPTETVEKKENQAGATATYVLAPPPGPQLVYAPDKENIDPFTGTRPSADQGAGKKRKTTLSVKAQPSSPTKRLKPLAEKATKKPASKARAAEKKTKRTALKRAASSRVHREPSLPRVTEETDAAEQAVIDSKCKDLTVLPLADISEAYDVASPKQDAVVAQEAEPSKEVATEVRLMLWLVLSIADPSEHRPPRAMHRRSSVPVAHPPLDPNVHLLQPLTRLPPASSLRLSASAFTPRLRSRRPPRSRSATRRHAAPAWTVSQTLRSSRPHSSAPPHFDTSHLGDYRTLRSPHALMPPRTTMQGPPYP